MLIFRLPSAVASKDAFRLPVFLERPLSERRDYICRRRKAEFRQTPPIFSAAAVDLLYASVGE